MQLCLMAGQKGCSKSQPDFLSSDNIEVNSGYRPVASNLKVVQNWCHLQGGYSLALCQGFIFQWECIFGETALDNTVHKTMGSDYLVISAFYSSSLKSVNTALFPPASPRKCVCKSVGVSIILGK